MAQEYELQASPQFRTGKSVNPVSVSGNWTPIISCATPGDLSVVHGTQIGRYVKIGEIVHHYIYVYFTPTFTTASGILFISGAPFLGDVLQGYPAAPVGVYNVAFPAAVEYLILFLNPSSGNYTLTGIRSNNTTSLVQMSEITSGTPTTIWGSATHFITGAS